MSLKRWIKSAGTLAALPPGYTEAVQVGDFCVHLEAFHTASPAFVSAQNDWQAISAATDSSLFLGWPWISSWLQVVVRDAPLLLLRIRQKQELVGIAFVAILERRILGTASRIAFLNELPLPGCDMVVEQNGLVTLRGYEQTAFQILMMALGQARLRIDEIRCRAVDERYLPSRICDGFYPRIDEEAADCWLVGRQTSSMEVTLTRNVLLKGFSKGKRWQIGRFMRLVEAEHGAVRVEIARTEDEARLFFERLEALHTEYWQAQGMSGSFRNPRWKAFHWGLIRSLLPTGKVQLLRIAAGAQDIGYLYNVGWGRTMNNIQCGFVYKADNRWRPGYVSQLLAAEVAGRCGYDCYDLLMGDDEYKSSIARRGSRLRWFSMFSRPAPGHRINRRYLLRMLLEIYRRVRANSKPRAQGDSRS